ncbi:MAG: family 10 glycosylhydrolase [Candidatus Poribacteria bacterium]|nr:family 10 glycosylhydrolase [Candidatus Poribacteria bacterium]
MSRPPQYSILYNWDGAPHGYSEVPQSMEAFLEKMYAPMEETQVGAHFWCIGEHAARWESEVLEPLGDVHGRRYESAQSYIHTENIRQMLERGEDPQEALITRGHQLGLHVYASIRMNDNHFNGAQVADLETMHHTELTRMRIEHPEWVLGDQTSEWFALSWNFAIPEIREHRYAHIKEICERYDWDGVELDWQRHAFHLPQDDGYRLRYVLTDLQRAVRRMTDESARKRGRPFYLAARVAGTLEMCRQIGYDIPTWVNEGLVDILIPAGGAATESSPDVAAFVKLCRDKEIAVYPGFDGGLPGAFVGPEDAQTKDQMRTRAIASRHHKAGATGIYVFNWHANRDSRRTLLSQIGLPDTLRGTDKIYAATHRFLQKEGEWRGAYRNDRIWGEVPVALKRTLTGEGPTITLDVADDLSADTPKKVELRVRLDQWVQGDVVRISWDGVVLEAPEVRYCAINNPHRISDVSGAAWLCFEMDAAKVEVGQHEVKVALEVRHPRVACDVVLTDVELVVVFS